MQLLFMTSVSIDDITPDPMDACYYSNVVLSITHPLHNLITLAALPPSSSK